MESDYVTLEQAEALLPRIKPVLESARRLKREIESIAESYDYDTVLMENERPRLTSLAVKLAQKLERLEDLGCYIKDLDIGLVDFLSEFEGRDVFLCWKLGETKISHWHELKEDFSMRQPIVDLNQLDLGFEFETPVIENEN